MDDYYLYKKNFGSLDFLLYIVKFPVHSSTYINLDLLILLCNTGYGKKIIKEPLNSAIDISFELLLFFFIY